MFVIRNVFRCKPGKAKALAEKLKTANSYMTDAVANHRVMVDEVADFWTVVIEFEVENLAAFEQGMAEYVSRPEVQAAMAGYMDLVDGGGREIFRIV